MVTSPMVCLGKIHKKGFQLIERAIFKPLGEDKLRDEREDQNQTACLGLSPRHHWAIIEHLCISGVHNKVYIFKLLKPTLLCTYPF